MTTAADARTRAVAVMNDLLPRLDADSELWLNIIAELGANYMKPTTATTVETMRTEAQRDAQYLALAADAVLAEYRKRWPAQP